MDSRIGRESRCPYNGFEAPFDESIKAEQKKKFLMHGKEAIMRNIFKEQEKDVSEQKRKCERTQKREIEQN